MDHELKPISLTTVFSEKSDVENNAEYTLSEYMPNIAKIVKAEAILTITEKNVRDGRIELYGEIVYTILYTAENSGLLKSVVFRENFEKNYDLRDIDGENVYIFVKSMPIHAAAKAQDARTLAVRSRFSLSTELYDMSTKNFFVDEHRNAECDVEYLRKQVDCTAARITETAGQSINESFEIDAGMAEISDIVDVRALVCVKNVSVSDGKVVVAAEMTLNCLYEAKVDDGGEYVSLEKTFPFKVDVDIPDVDGTWSAIADVKLLSVSCDSSADNFGEMRVIDASASVQIAVAAMKNTQSTLFEDVYCTNCPIVPKKETVHIYSLVDTYTGLIEHTEKLRFELRGISDIISCSLCICFSNPEISEGAVVLPARGILNILGMKETGEIDSRSSQVSLRLPESSIPESLFGQKIKWFNFSSVCRHECEILGGELVLKLWINESLAAIKEESVSVVTEYDKGEEKENCKKHSFVIYYPEKGESAWSVAKEHGVSCNRMCAENGISGDVIERTKPIILR